QHVFLSGNLPTTMPVDDYTDRVADIQTRVSMPALVRQITADLLVDQKNTASELQRTIDHYTKDNNLRAFINVLGASWKAPKDSGLLAPLLIDDPVHGVITLDSCLATVIAQPIVQRLSRVRQLSFSYTHFPSANHSRLSHVIGVAYNVERALGG